MNARRPKQPETIYVGFPTPKRLETVAELDKEFGNTPKKFDWIAQAYGYPPADPDDTNSVWTGPFYNAAGNVDTELVKKEIAEPGSVVPPDFKSHNQLLREARHIESRRLQFVNTLTLNDQQRAAKEAEEQLPNRTEADIREDIKSLLAEGVFIIPNLVDQAPGATVELVQKVASELGIEVFVNSDCYASPGRKLNDRETQTARQHDRCRALSELRIIDHATHGQSTQTTRQRKNRQARRRHPEANECVGPAV